MEEVRQLVQEEGREARNLVAFHVAVDTPVVRVARRPGRGGAARAAARLRSASAGRDKRSELRARYWALLFGDLQRAIGEIYNTVEAHENLNECQEVILVLENYTRDFKALGEWFRLKWEYDNTPPPQRPQSLAWEIRKTDFVRPDSRRTYSVKSSPSVSGKNSPCLSGHNTPSGKNSPNLTGKASPGSGKISPRISSGHSSSSPKGNIEFFSTKKSSKIITPPEPKFAKEIPRLYEIKEREKEITEETDELLNKTEAGPINTKVTPTRKELKDEEFRKEKIGNQVTVEIGKAKECSNTCPKQVIIKTPKRIPKTNDSRMTTQLSSPVKATISKLEAMESEFLAKHLIENEAKNENLLNEDKEIHVSKTEKNREHNEKPVDNDKENITTESPVKSDDNFADVSSESSNKSNDENLVGHSKYKPIENKINNDLVPKAMERDDNTSVKKHFEKSTDGGSLENANITIEVKNAKETAKYSSADIKDQSLEVKDEKKEQEEQKKAELKTDLKSNAKPAYSQAAAKPKPVSAKTEVKAPSRLTALTRSKTVVEIRPSSVTRAPKKNLSSKCSYPFNLTTGRTSLFDGPANKGTVKKIVNRIQTASGDTKTTPNKLDIKKRPPRPSSLKINEKGINSDKISSTLGKIKDYDEYSSSDTIVTQINMSRIESSESLKTLVPEEQTIQDVANSLELLNIDGDKNDNEGWLTVKSRRLSRESKKHWKSHWANRFHQPSATTSLPTLNMIESPKQDAKSILSEPNTDRAQSEQPQYKPEIAVKVTEEPKVEKPKDPAMIRQKSDVTGLKTRSSRNRAMKKEKVKDRPKEDGELTKNRLHSSLESLTTGLARSQESTEEVFDFDKWKTEFKTTLRYMEDDDPLSDQHEILNTADPNEMSEIVAMTSQIEENEKKISWALDFQSDVDQRKLCEEEDLLNRQIMELQQVSDIDLDTETDDTETDAEILCDTRTSGQSSESLGSLAVSLEDQYETALAGMSWAERVDTLGLLEALVARDPGRAQQLHAKLSQGIKRRGSFQDALRRLQAKQARAERQRLEYQTERARKIHQLLARVEEVKIAKNQLIEAKRLRMERRLQRAAENRHQHIKDIVRKAHDEEEKLREIAFIKQLEAQNRRHDFLAHCRSHTTRLRLMRRERLHKLEQKAARDAAVGARREALEEARRERVASLLERRRLRDQRHERLRELRRRQRGDAAREKAEGVKSRLSALAAAAEMETLALQSRIRHKQDASQQRLDAHLQAIREKATGPRQQTTSESHDQSSKEEKELAEEAERLEQERKEREKQKAIKKRARKVKQKLLATSTDISSAVDNIPSSEIYIYPASNRMYKVLQQLNSIITPLLDPENEKRHDSTQNGFEIDEPVGKKNKKGKNKVVNGDKTENNHGRDIIEVKIDKPRNKKSMNKTSNEDNMNNNSNENKNAHNITNNVKNKTKTIDSSVKDTETIEIIEIDLNNKEIELKNDDAKTNEKDAKDSKHEAIEVKTENSKRRKKKKDQEEKPKLSKASSVCSSLSDMSKTSVKEKRAKETIDVAFIERQLNELHRTMERFDRSIPDKLTFSKVNGLRTLGLLLGVAADREDLAPHFTARSLTTAVMVVCRAVGASEAAAIHFITSNICVHVIKLLSNQLEKDVQSDPREMDLARQLCDCLSIALDSVLCQTRLYAEKCERRETSDACGESLAPLRSRCHTLISYICLCGCITRAEKAGEARESVQTLLTICVDLCQPCCVDVGGERVSATQSLRCALGRGVCGSRAEFCMLFAAGAELAPSGAFVRAARTAHLLRSLADLDHNTVQEAFGEGGWPLEFRAAVARLLSQHAPNEKEAPRTSVLGLTGRRLDHTLSETMVLDLIVLVGFVVVNNPQLQETICDGWSVIKMLCTLPANWLVSRPHCHALLPTLVALSEHTETAAAIAAELSTGMLEEYMESPEAQKVKLVQVIKQGRAKKAGQKSVRLG